MRYLAAILAVVFCIGSSHAQVAKTTILPQINTSSAQGLLGGTILTNIVNSYVDWLTCTGTGGMLYWSLGTPTCLNVGSSGTFLTVSGSVPAWSSTIPTSVITGQFPNSNLANPLTTVNGVTRTLGSSCTVTTANSTIDNFLPNVQWQLFSSLSWIPKYKQDVSGYQGLGICSAFSTTNNQPTFTCSNTSGIKVGDLVTVIYQSSTSTFTASGSGQNITVSSITGTVSLGQYLSGTGVPLGTVITGCPGGVCGGAGVYTTNLPTTASGTVSAYSQNFWSYGGSVITCATAPCGSAALVTSERVVAVTTNTSIVIQPPLGALSPASSVATYILPISPGDPGVLARGPDGWVKTATLILTVDDFPANGYPGAYRPLLLIKGAAGTESFCWNAPAGGAYTGGTGVLPAFSGRTVTIGAAIAGKTGTTWTLTQTDNTGTTTSSVGTGTGAGGYQFLSSTRTIATNPSSFQECLNLTGSIGDYVWFALPTSAFVSSMTQSQLHQNSNEIIRAVNHWNPPLLNGLNINFPGSVLVTGCACYGWNEIDLESISNGQIHKSVSGVATKLECNIASAGATILTGNNANGNYYTFGPQCTTPVASVANSSGGPIMLPLNYDGTFTINGATAASATIPSGEIITFDFTNAYAAMPTSVN